MSNGKTWRPDDSATLEAEERCRREVKRNRDEASAIAIGIAVLAATTVCLSLLVHFLRWAWEAFTR